MDKGFVHQETASLRQSDEFGTVGGVAGDGSTVIVCLKAERKCLGDRLMAHFSIGYQELLSLQVPGTINLCDFYLQPGCWTELMRQALSKLGFPGLDKRPEECTGAPWSIDL
jgi:hypothetical protein